MESKNEFLQQLAATHTDQIRDELIPMMIDVMKTLSPEHFNEVSFDRLNEAMQAAYRLGREHVREANDEIARQQFAPLKQYLKEMDESTEGMKGTLADVKRVLDDLVQANERLKAENQELRDFQKQKP
jgi:hypothetical protein